MPMPGSVFWSRCGPAPSGPARWPGPNAGWRWGKGVSCIGPRRLRQLAGFPDFDKDALRVGCVTVSRAL
eukprot:3243559-Rhodomonas_salina.1